MLNEVAALATTAASEMNAPQGPYSHPQATISGMTGKSKRVKR